jgi:hypothetical protein
MGIYAEGLDRWRSKDFAGAFRSFEQISTSDPPARFFMERCRALIQSAPAAGWSYVHVLERK